MTKNNTILFTPNCIGGRHGVSLIRRGRKLSLTLHSHGEDSDFPIETVRSFQALDPEFRCRCLEILDAWKFYTRAANGRVTSAGAMPFREFIELYPWGRAAFFKKLSGKDVITPSMVLSVLPKEFREEAKASRSLRGKRQRNKEVFLVDRSGNPELMPRWAKESFHGSQGGRSSQRILPMESFVERCGHTDWKPNSYWEDGHRTKRNGCLPRGRVSSLKLNRYLQKLFERHGNSKFPQFAECIDSLLGTNDSCVYGTREKGDVNRRTTRLRWIRLYWKYEWMKELVRAGFIPVDIPPECCWEYDRKSQPLYPRVASVIKYDPQKNMLNANGDFKKQFNLYSIRIMETHDEEKKFFYTSFPVFGSRFDT